MKVRCNVGRRFCYYCSKTVLLSVTIVSIVSGITSCSRKDNHSRPCAELKPVRLGVQDNLACGLIWMAQGYDLFEENKLDLEIIRYPSGKLALQGFLRGEVDYAAVGDMPVAMLGFQTNEVRIIATIAENVNAAWIIARRDRGIESAQDLKGKRIGTQQNSAVHFFLGQYLLFNQLTTQEVDIVFMKATELPDALLSGAIDAFSMRNPFVSQAKQQLGTNTIEFYGDGIYLHTFILLTSESCLKTHSAETVHLLETLLQAEKLILSDLDESERAALRALGMNRKEELATDWPSFQYNVSLSQSLLLTLEQQARWAQQIGLATNAAIPNYLNMVSPEPLRQVSPSSVTMITEP